MALCRQCGTSVTDGLTMCAACGANITSSVLSSQQEDIHRLLAEANLLRTRERFDEAISTCTRVLRMDASNAPAHALLGDIYLAQNNQREAMGWYKLAVQLNPTNTVLRKKLDDIIDHIYHGDPQARVQQKAKVAATSGTKKTPEPDGLLPKALYWFTHLSPMHLVIGCTAIFAIAGIVLIIQLTKPVHTTVPNIQEGNTPDAQRNYPIPDITVDNSTPPPPPTVVVPPPVDSVENGQIRGLPGLTVTNPNATKPTGAGAATVPNATTPADGSAFGTQLPSANGAVTKPAVVGDPGTPREIEPVRPLTGNTQPEKQTDSSSQSTRQLRAAITAELKQSNISGTLDKVDIDDTTGQVTLRYSIPRSKDLLTTKQGLIYVGFHLVEIAHHYIDTPSFTLQGAACTADSATPINAVSTTITAKQAQVGIRSPDYHTAQQYFSNANTLWRNDLIAIKL